MRIIFAAQKRVVNVYRKHINDGGFFNNKTMTTTTTPTPTPTTNISDNSIEFIEYKRFKSFAVLDLETNDLITAGINKVAPTEFSLYGFAAVELEKSWRARNICNDEIIRSTTTYNETNESSESLQNPWPARPRVLHKLTLMLYPRLVINPIAEKITGLSNYNLEFEKHFDENAANTVLGFLKHLQQPVCLVAHNGFGFDYRIIKNCFQKLNMSIPDDVLCIDSLRAFQKIDEMRLLIDQNNDAINLNESSTSASSTSPLSPIAPLEAAIAAAVAAATAATKAAAEAATAAAAVATAVAAITSTTSVIIDADKDKITDIQKRNETTPKRPIIKNLELGNIMRKTLNNETIELTNGKRRSDDDNEDHNDVVSSSTINSTNKKARRRLFPSDPMKKSQLPNFKKYPPKGVYKLSKIFERIFQQKPSVVHQAEADVDMLMRLMLHYGVDFLEYTEKYAIPFADIKR